MIRLPKNKKVSALIGYPLGHSVSAPMHNAAFRRLGLDHEYLPIEVEPKNLEEIVNELRDGRVLGFNVTIPFKEAIILLLDDITELADTIGAVNTVKNQDGKLVGYNTDAPGFIESLKDEAGFSPKGKNVVVIGAGGASRAVCAILAKSGIKKLTISDSLPQKAVELAGYIKDNFGVEALALEAGDPIIQREINQANLLVNTSPVGMAPKAGECPLSDDVELHPGLTVYDLVYNPRETKLLKRAKQAKANAISGLGMLVRQGALAFELFTGAQPPLDAMYEAAEEALRNLNA